MCLKPLPHLQPNRRYKSRMVWTVTRKFSANLECREILIVPNGLSIGRFSWRDELQLPRIFLKLLDLRRRVGQMHLLRSITRRFVRSHPLKCSATREATALAW